MIYIYTHRHTLLEKDGEAEIGGFQWCILVLVEQQEILRLKITVDDTHGMASMHNLHNNPKQRRGGTFGVMTFSNNPIKQLTTSAKLHNKMNGLFILISSLELHDIRLSGQMVHYLYFSPDIFNILLIRELPFGNRLACKGLIRGLVSA